MKPVIEGKTGIDKIYLSKKNIEGVLKRMLYKYKKDIKNEVYPGYWIEKRGLLAVVKELYDAERNIYILDRKGEDLREIEIKRNPIFILGDHLGLPEKEFKRLKKMCKSVSIGKKTYFASHTIAVVNNEIDRREEKGEI